ncbi:hypothetical protein [Qipengyuania sp.]|uniref:hypothetical protein n=1 Tax=Qipengyuania sp. TaxID=2004515 RepID=UPI0035C7DAF8
MKPIYSRLAGSLALTFAIAACVPQPRPAPPPAEPTPAPAPAPVAAPAPVYSNWMDAPRTAGDWYYLPAPGGGTAVFGPSQGDGRFTLRCIAPQKIVVLSRMGQARSATTMTIRTETVTRSLAASPTAGQPPAIEARLPAADPLLDAIALSKGRFAVEIAGQPSLYLPSWAEVTRVIEDCR